MATIRTCLACPETFTAGGPGSGKGGTHRKLYCSPKCKTAFSSQVRTQVRRALGKKRGPPLGTKHGPRTVTASSKVTVRVCKHCDENFSVTGPGSHNKLYCSPKCKSDFAQARKEIRRCTICDGPLAHGQKKACGAECRAEVARQRGQRFRDASRNNPDDPPVDWEGEYIYVETDRRKKLREMFERYDSTHWDRQW
jgi:hypothetical protein